LQQVQSTGKSPKGKKAAQAAQRATQQQALRDYAVHGPPEEPAYDAAEQASSMVQMLLRADVVLTTYQGVRHCLQIVTSGGVGSAVICPV